MSNVLTGIVEPAKQENKNSTDNRPPSARSFLFSMVFLAVFAALFLWQMARNDNPMWTVAKPLAQPVTRPTQAQAVQQAAQVQASPTAPALATPTMIQPTATPVEIRPTLEMGIIPTRYAEPTIDVAALEKQIQLQAEQKRLELDIQREKDNLDKARAEWEDARNQKYLVWGLVSLGVIFGLIVAMNVYARSIVANIKQAGELAKARQNAPQATTKAVEPRKDEVLSNIPPCTVKQFVDWWSLIDKAGKTPSRDVCVPEIFPTRDEYYKFFEWLISCGLVEKSDGYWYLTEPTFDGLIPSEYIQALPH